jgi:hypothetical protein
MNSDQWRSLIVNAVNNSDSEQLTSLAKHLAACEEANTILRSKGYGQPGQMINDAARLVPHARDFG